GTSQPHPSTAERAICGGLAESTGGPESPRRDCLSAVNRQRRSTRSSGAIVADRRCMFDLERFRATRVVRRLASAPPVEDPSAQLAPVLARFRAVDPGRSIVRAWAEDVEVTIVMLTRSLRLATNTFTALLECDDVIALGAQQRYTFTNDAECGDQA